MKHLGVLEAAGIVVGPRWSGREKLHFLNPVPIRLIHNRWIHKVRGAPASGRHIQGSCDHGDEVVWPAGRHRRWRSRRSGPAQKAEGFTRVTYEIDKVAARLLETHRDPRTRGRAGASWPGWWRASSRRRAPVAGPGRHAADHASPDHSRDQQQCRPDDDHLDGSRRLLTGRRELSTVMAAVTTAIAPRFMTPAASRMTIRLAHRDRTAAPVYAMSQRRFGALGSAITGWTHHGSRQVDGLSRP